MTVWQIWLLIAAVFIVIEICTSGFAVACFSVGCICSAILAACDVSLTWQIVAFAIGTFLAFIFIRPFVMKIIDKKTNDSNVKTNMDNIIGKTAVVTERIEEGGYGRVKLDGDDWKAVSEDGSVIEKGTEVEIVKLDSIILTVKQ